MNKYLLDTGILIGYLRSAPYAEYVEREYQPFALPNVGVISIVTKAEIYSFALSHVWPDKKKQQLKDLLTKIPIVDINNDLTIERYAEIDAYSQGKLPSRKLPTGMSSRNMGKNDLWIAATTSVLSATLLTTDHDFDHLSGSGFLDVKYIDPKTKP
jgi:predicted nucleic acid-binding protein